eukprot:COSAG04_NODE_2098_length_4786_cov_436.917004_3_plen_100_part_00
MLSRTRIALRADEKLGPCMLWSTVLGFWAFQFVPLLWNWKAWHPDSIAACHAQIEAEREVLGVAAGGGGGGGAAPAAAAAPGGGELAAPLLAQGPSSRE